MNSKLKKITANIVAISLMTSLCISGIPIQKAYADSNTGIWNFSYTGNAQTFKAPHTGTYTLEGWGAGGGKDTMIGGSGGYAKGDINLTAGQTLSIYAGGKGGRGNNAGGGFNGGGNAGIIGSSGSGGGATDFRLNGTALSNRILVAGGGGGGGNMTLGGAGGGTTGGNATNGGYGGSQTSGGSAINGGQVGSLGKGGNCPVDGGGGGGGYYGGGSGGDGNHITVTGTPPGDFGGGGGSAYIGGVSNGTTNSGVNSENGYAKITYLNPTLNVTPDPTNNSINMDWSVADSSKDYSYMIYSKASTDSTFQSIPAKSNIKVLNVYPSVGNNLKSWMQTYGKGLISVDDIDIENFNNNPNVKDSNGNYYDVIMFGSWDNNNYKDLTITSKNVVESFINSGRGVLFGHDTIDCNQHNINFDMLAKYVNISYVGGYIGGIPSISIVKKGLLTNYPWNIGDVETNLTVPVSHSWGQRADGDIWMKFNNTDTSLSNFYLTTWNNTAMIQTGHSNGKATEDEQKLIANTLFYLGQLTTDTSWVDHKGQDLTAPNPTSITDVSANSRNTQFTVNYTQPTDNGSTYEYYVESTSKLDNTKLQSEIKSATITTGIKGYAISVDKNPTGTPNKDNLVTGTSYTFDNPYSKGTNFYVHIASVDGAGNMSTVTNYFVDNTAPILRLSPSTATWTNSSIVITATGSDDSSGVKNIKLPNGTYITGSKATYVVKSNGNYDFIIYDNNGNYTKKSIYVDSIKTTGSNLSISPNKSNFTNQNVTLTATFSDDLNTIKTIETPDGVKTRIHNKSPKVLVIEWSNRTTPIADKLKSLGYDVTLDDTVTTLSQLQGYDIIVSDQHFWAVTKGTLLNQAYAQGYRILTQGNDTTNSIYPITSTVNNTKTFEQKRTVINEVTESIDVTNVGDTDSARIVTGIGEDSVAWSTCIYYPNSSGIIYSHNKNGGKWIHIQPVMKDSSYNEFYMSAIDELMTGSKFSATQFNKSYTATTNGNYTFKITDFAGNVTTKNITVSNIDKTAPTLNLTQNPTAFTTGNVVITATATDEESGISQIQLPDGTWVSGSTITYTATSNGIYQFSVRDTAGNVTTKSITISNIDRTAPTLILTQDNLNWVNGSITIKVKAIDEISGVKQIILPNGSVVQGSTATYSVSDIGVYYFKAVDNTGNVGINYITISNIDKNKPTVTITNNKNWSNANSENVIITATDN